MGCASHSPFYLYLVLRTQLWSPGLRDRHHDLLPFLLAIRFGFGLKLVCIFCFKVRFHYCSYQSCVSVLCVCVHEGSRKVSEFLKLEITGSGELPEGSAWKHLTLLLTAEPVLYP